MKGVHAVRMFALIGVTALFMGGGCPPQTPGTTTTRDPIPGATQGPQGAPPTNGPNLPPQTNRWREQNLTYFIADLSGKTPQQKQIDMIADAFNRWSAVTPLNFTRTMDRAASNFTVGWGTGTHCNLYVNLTCPTAPFEASTLGHAYFPDGPNRGQCHMNEVHNWADDRLLLSTLVHELGHNLGLDHLPENNAVMFANDNNQTGDLQAPDITAIQRLYGSRDGSVRPAPRAIPAASDTGLNRTATTTTLPDQDGDGIDDATERYVLGTNPFSKDSDNDGVDDGVELRLGLDPSDDDTDEDGLGDGAELDGGTNCYRPDNGISGDATAFVGKYIGTDSLGTTLEFTVAADGTVEGKLALKQYGFDEDEELIGACGADGKMELVSYDYFFDYEGTIVAAAAGGLFVTDAQTNGTWTAAKTPRLKVDDGAPIQRTNIEKYLR